MYQQRQTEEEYQKASHSSNISNISNISNVSNESSVNFSNEELGIQKTDYIELTIEDVAIDTVIEIRQYMRENGIQEKRTMYGHDLFRWLMKNS